MTFRLDVDRDTAIKMARSEAIKDCLMEIERRTILEATTDDWESGYRTALLDLESAILKMAARR